MTELTEHKGLKKIFYARKTHVHAYIHMYIYTYTIICVIKISHTAITYLQEFVVLLGYVKVVWRVLVV